MLQFSIPPTAKIRGNSNSDIPGWFCFYTDREKTNPEVTTIATYRTGCGVDSNLRILGYLVRIVDTGHLLDYALQQNYKREKTLIVPYPIGDYHLLNYALQYYKREKTLLFDLTPQEIASVITNTRRRQQSISHNE